jgi:CRP-like cAMP-binding protein
MPKRASAAVTADLLRVFPLLQGLSDDVLQQIAVNSIMRKFSRRAIVLNAGVHEEFLCLLFEGRLQGVDFTVDGREVGIYFIEPRGFCGEIGLVDKGVQPEYVMALCSSQVIQVPLPLLRQIINQSPILMHVLCQRMATKIRVMTRQRGLLGLPNIAQRVCGQLWMLVQSSELPEQQVKAIESPPTHQEIAIMLNLSRETVTRVFQQLQGQKIVKRDGNTRLLIDDIQRLSALARGESEL